MSRTVVFAILWTSLLVLPVSATTLHVPGDYPLILDAMFFATAGDTVLVECGIYYEGNIQMKSGVTLISETGELGCAMINAQNMSRVIECVDCDENTAIIGFSIAGGYVTGTNSYGAGISCSNSSPRLENLDILVCQVRAIDAYGGGGIGCLNSSPTLTNVVMRGCVLVDATAHGGGAMVVLGESSPTLNNVLFDGNWTTDSWGGALSVEGYGGQRVSMNDVTFIENSAATSGGGMHVGGCTTVTGNVVFHDNWAPKGGGVHLETCRPCTLADVTFTENTAASGAGGGLLDETSPDGRLTLTNATFLGNTASTDGGGMACNAANLPVVSYATFGRNSASTGGGLDVAATTIRVSNSTFYGNDASSSGGGIHIDNASSLDLDASIIAYSTTGEGIGLSTYTPPIITCTDIYGNAGGDWVGVIAPLDGVNGNLWVDPLFCDAPGDDYTLAADSECLAPNNSCAVLMGAHGLGCPPSTGIDGIDSGATVHAAAPNPFGHTTALTYELPSAGAVAVRVFDVSGKLVRTLVDSEHQTAGLRTLVWNGRDDGGRPVASGVYFFRVDIGGESVMRRAVLLR
ncbi:MAG: FlgD immunoglobulin-like domain containing protein [Gemmatimonadota bacterium]